MKKGLFVICSFFLLNILCACNSSEDSAVILGVEEPTYVESFEHKKTLTPDSSFRSDIYFEDFAICDSFVFTGSGAWDIRILPEWKSVKRIFSKGHALGEFIQLPKVYKSSFIHENNELYTIVYDMGNGNVFKANITKTLSLDTLCIKEVSHKSKKWLDRYLYVDKNEFVTRENTQDFSPKKLTHYKYNELSSNKYFEKLNSIEFGSEDYNIISALEGYNKKRNLIIQAYVYFNIINIIPLNDKEKAVTLCYGEKGIPYNDVAKEVERKRFFYEVRTYEDCFAVLCLKDINHPSVLFFDYDGNPQKEFILKSSATSFDVDWIQHDLYTHNEEDEMITRYKIEG